MLELIPQRLVPATIQIRQVLLELMVPLEGLFEMVQLNSDFRLLMGGPHSLGRQAFERGTVPPLQSRFRPALGVEPGKSEGVLHDYVR